MPEDEKQQSKADLSAYTIELRQLRMEEKAMRKVFEECSGQLTQLQVPLLIFQSFLNHIQCLKITPKVALHQFYKIASRASKGNEEDRQCFLYKMGATFGKTQQNSNSMSFAAARKSCNKNEILWVILNTVQSQSREFLFHL